MKYLQRRPRTCIKEMLPRIDRREVIRQDAKDGEWICLKGEEVLQMVGVRMIEEYVHSEEVRDDHEIRKMRNIYGKCKSSQEIDSNLLWLDYNHYSHDAAEALKQKPGARRLICRACLQHPHTHQPKSINRARRPMQNQRRRSNHRRRNTPSSLTSHARLIARYRIAQDDTRMRGR
jgi:hypothetical protein